MTMIIVSIMTLLAVIALLASATLVKELFYARNENITLTETVRKLRRDVLRAQGDAMRNPYTVPVLPSGVASPYRFNFPYMRDSEPDTSTFFDAEDA